MSVEALLQNLTTLKNGIKLSNEHEQLNVLHKSTITNESISLIASKYIRFKINY